MPQPDIRLGYGLLLRANRVNVSPILFLAIRFPRRVRLALGHGLLEIPNVQSIQPLGSGRASSFRSCLGTQFHLNTEHAVLFIGSAGRTVATLSVHFRTFH